MSIETIFANISCADLEASVPWYQKVFGVPPTRRPMDGLAEWAFTDSAEVQLYENTANAGRSTLTIRVHSLEHERTRLEAEGVETASIEPTKDFFLMRLNDPDGNLVVMVSARRT
ncbi:MAG TPA: VOC family protein [Luteitalea sp.]|nr:VOC family protein [Luteitalea sp.]